MMVVKQSRLFLITLIIGFHLVFPAGCSTSQTVPGTPSSPPGTLALEGLSLMLPLLRPEQAESDLARFRPYLRPGDILVDGIRLQNILISEKNRMQGLKIGVGGTSIPDLKGIVTRIRSGMDYLTYDYEPDFTPEWTDDVTSSITFFKQASELAHAKGLKFVVVPVYVYGREWDWGRVVMEGGVDLLVLQVQNFQTGARVPPELNPETLGESLVDVVQKVVGQVRQKQPETKIFLQFDLIVTDRVENVLTDMQRTRSLGIDGYTLWYRPTASGLQRIINLLARLNRG